MRTSFFIFLLAGILSLANGQTYQAGLILPTEPDFDACCIFIPASGFTLYEAPSLDAIAGCLLPGPSTDPYQGFRDARLLVNTEETTLPITQFKRVGYEVFALEYAEDKGRFIRVLDRYWIHKDALKKDAMGFESWKSFLIRESGNLLGYYANGRGLNLRTGPSTDFEKIITIKGDEMEIGLTKEVKGLWNKVQVKVYKVHPCNADNPEEPKILAKHQGWVKLLDDNGTPNIHWYPGGC